MPPKIEVLVFLKKINSMCRGSIILYIHGLNLRYNNFLYVFFIVKKQPFM